MPPIVPDELLRQSVEQQLRRLDIRGPEHVHAAIQGGDVTLSGQLSYGHQRRSLIQAARNIPGVRRVIDRLRVVPRKNR